ncbi:MAG: Crp/Fnr family transcriptional regulator, partial [Leptospiraceae bacterium]|nr:Crp/Fnr family transcriptional regulator [Leptospiraceae bacterium]
IDSEHRLSDKVLSRFEAGDSFGMVSALTGHRFLVTITAGTDAAILQIPVNSLGSYMKGQKELAIRILGLYSRELRALQRHLAKTNVPAERGFHPQRLVGHAQTYLNWGQPKLASYSLHKYIEWAEKSGDADGLAHAKQKLAGVGTDYAGPRFCIVLTGPQQGAVLFLESELSAEVFVVLSGKVKLFNIVRGQEYVMDVIGAGEIFGEMSLIEHEPRMASAVTETECEIMRLPADKLFDNVGVQLLQKIFLSLARRIWFSHQRLIILRIEQPVTRLYAFLYNSIRDRDIKMARPVNQSYSEKHHFQITFDELKTMCGIIRVKPETLKEFNNDSNIEITDTEIIVHNRKRLEEKLVFFKTRAGQIAADLV